MRHSSQALEQFLVSVERRAFVMAKIATRNTDDALDIVQDAMLGFVKRYAKRTEDEWKILFFTTLQSRIRDWYRRTRVRTRWRVWLDEWRSSDEAPTGDPMAKLADPAGHSPAERMILDDSRAALEAALRSLPLRQQQAFLLRAWEGMNVRETAAVMRCSEGSVKTHYSRAVTTLRTLLENQWT